MQPVHFMCLRARSPHLSCLPPAPRSAIERGQWVLLDSANLCNPTVLDRLNPLLEPQGGCRLPRQMHGSSAGMPLPYSTWAVRICFCASSCKQPSPGCICPPANTRRAAAERVRRGRRRRRACGASPPQLPPLPCTGPAVSCQSPGCCAALLAWSLADPAVQPLSFVAGWTRSALF